MKVSLWAEIRRLHEIQRWSKNAIARQLNCCHKTVSQALAMEGPPSQTVGPARTSKLEANVRVHETTRERPLDRFGKEQPLLRALPPMRFDTDQVVTAVVSSHARVPFDSNRYSVPPKLVRKTEVLPVRLQWIAETDYDSPDPACYDRLYEELDPKAEEAEA